MDQKAMIVQLTVEELRALMKSAVAEANTETRPEPLEYLTLEKAAKLTGFDERTVLNHVKLRGLPAMKIVHEWRFDRAELVRWMAEQKFKMKEAG